MPRAYDRRPLTIDRNPLWTIMPELPKLSRDAPTFYTSLIESIKNLTGLDLSSPAALVASIGDLISSGLGLDQIAKMFGFIDIPASIEQLGEWLRPHLFGQIPSWRLGNIPAAHIGNFNPELLEDPGFDFESTIANNPSYVWDGAVGRGSTLGSARTTADGTTRILRSNRFEVSAGQKIDVKAYARWQGLTYTAGAGGPIRLSVTLYNGDTIVGSYAVSSISPVSVDATDWAMLAGQYQIPTGSTATHAAVMLTVDSSATAGNVWFDDGSARKVGLIAQELVAGLQAAIQARIDEFQSVINKGWEALTGLPATINKTIEDWKTALQNIPQANIKDFGAALAGAGQNMRDAIVQALGGTGTGHTTLDVLNALGNIPQHVIQGLEDELADAGDAIADVFDDVRDGWKKFWNGIFKTPTDTTPRTADEVQAAAASITSAVDGVKVSNETLASTILMPRTKPLYESKWPQDDVSFPVFNIDGFTTPTLGRLYLIPVTASVDREYQSLKFGLQGTSMTNCYVGVYSIDTATGAATLISNLGDVKGSLSGSVEQQSLALPASISAARGDNFYIGILQVGGTAAGLKRSSLTDNMTDYPTSYPQFYGNIVAGTLGSLPSSITAGNITASTRFWGALGYGVSPPPPPKQYFGDSFDRADGPLGSNWIARKSGLQVVSNRAAMAAGGVGVSSAVPRFTTNNQGVRVTLPGSPSPSGQSAVFLRASSAMMVGFIMATGSDNRIVTCPGFDVGNASSFPNCTTRATSSSPFPGPAPSSRPYELTAVGNVYTAKWMNGSSTVSFSWTDSGGIVPINSGQREAAIAAVAGSVGYVDNFEMWDI